MLKFTPMQLRRLWLLLATVVSVGIVGHLIAQEAAVLRDARKQQAAYTESFVPSVYQLEREYLRFTHRVEMAVHGLPPPDLNVLAFSLDLLASRLEVMDNSLAAADFRKTSEFMTARSLLGGVVQRAEVNLHRKARTAADWAPVALELQALSPAMNALTMRASLMVSLEQEMALSVQAEAASSMMTLLLGLLLLLLLSALSIGTRQGRVERERLRLHLLHEQARAANEKAEAANAGKSRFLANMSHELRTPLNGMLGMLNLLEDTPLNAQQDDYVQTAHRSATHLLDLLNDILDASALEAGKMTLKPEPVHMPSLVADVQALMKPAALEKRLQLTVHHANNVPPWLLADGTRVKQIMLNLVSNALKFSEHGTVLVEVGLVNMGLVPQGQASATPPEPGDSAHLFIRVTDQGPGMSAEVLGKLFQRFEQGDASSARRFGGSGLGLEISRNLARRMDGDIEATSTEGQGSVFTATLRLPLSAPSQEQASDMMLARREPGSPGLNLVVAEDNAINRKYMAALLRNMGHTVRFAEDGLLVVQEVQKEIPDMVLMDLHMPEVDGLQATEAIRKLPAPLGALPIIALTADVFEESRDRVNAAGMDGFLSKPVNVHELEKLLVHRFGLRGASVAATPVSPPAPPAEAAPVADAHGTARPAEAPRARRRFRPGDVAEHLNMAMIGELCVGVTLQGYQSLLEGVLRADSECYQDLLAALDAGDTRALLELGHSFKGVASSLGLAAMARLALTIEKQGHAFSADECKAHAESLRDCWNTTFAICARMGLIASS